MGYPSRSMRDAGNRVECGAMAGDGAAIAEKCQYAWAEIAGVPTRRQAPMQKKSGPKAGKNLQQQAQRLAGTSQCGEKFIMYEINYKM
ncbi:hypothetical protein [Achromobacter dolens]|uniref:hypothetical protein n=1 Tax=Achromobacter dolens TaxID=1287738 RepID=UPI003555C72E